MTSLGLLGYLGITALPSSPRTQVSGFGILWNPQSRSVAVFSTCNVSYKCPRLSGVSVIFRTLHLLAHTNASFRIFQFNLFLARSAEDVETTLVTKKILTDS